jgi:hypothetical protein
VSACDLHVHTDGSGGQGLVLGHLKDKPFDVLVDPIGEESEDQSYTVLGLVGTYAHIYKE